MSRVDPAAKFYLREDLFWLSGRQNNTEEFDHAEQGRLMAALFNLEGEVYREVGNRRTIRFVSPPAETLVEHSKVSSAYFAKIHGGVGWREILKNWLTLKRPVTGAGNEIRACLHLQSTGIPAPIVAAFGERRCNPARRESFVICEAVEPSTSLEAFCSTWRHHPPDPLRKRALLNAVADITREIHASGLVHRDFYICHLLLDEDLWRKQQVHLTVIDLHRALIFPTVPQRWLERDLAALLFSTLDLGLSKRDWLRFVRRYRGGRDLRKIFAEEADLWRRVYTRAIKLYFKGVRKGLSEGHFYASTKRKNPVKKTFSQRHQLIVSVEGDLYKLQIEQTLRHLPGRRIVVRATCSGSPSVTDGVEHKRSTGKQILLKIFFGSHQARRMEREVNGIHWMHKAGVPTPELLWRGTVVSSRDTADACGRQSDLGAGDGSLVLAFAWLPDATDLGRLQTFSQGSWESQEEDRSEDWRDFLRVT